MKMKRGLAFALAALALVAGNAAVQAADIDLSLNLRYTNPSTPAAGGNFYLLAKTNTAGANTGIAGLSVYLSGIDAAGIEFGNATAEGVGNAAYPVVAAAGLGGNVNNGGLPLVTTAAGVTNIVYGQDLVTKLLTIGEGTGTPGNLTVDPLRNAAWANSTLLLSGTFGATRPAFAASGANSTDGNVYDAGGTAVDATISTVVRGDSLKTLNLEPNGGGLLFGDLNRNGTVGFTTDINPALGQIGQGSGKTWDQGDFNGNGSVGFTTDINPALANIGVPAPPAPISAVPEPAAAGMIMVGMGALAAIRRRK